MSATEVRGARRAPHVSGQPTAPSPRRWKSTVLTDISCEAVDGSLPGQADHRPERTWPRLLCITYLCGSDLCGSEGQARITTAPLTRRCGRAALGLSPVPRRCVRGSRGTIGRSPTTSDRHRCGQVRRFRGLSRDVVDEELVEAGGQGLMAHVMRTFDPL